jgi:hypothetical protein
MSDAEQGDETPRPEEPTSPFPLERGKSEPPPPIEGQSLMTTSGEHTGPFLLEREILPESEPPPAPLPPLPLAPRARRARRNIAITLLVHTLLLASLAVLSIVRYDKGVGSFWELGFAVLTGGIGLVHLRAGVRFARIGRSEPRDAVLLAGALHDLRTVIVMKALALFFALTLLCFSLSMIISLVVTF